RLNRLYLRFPIVSQRCQKSLGGVLARFPRLRPGDWFGRQRLPDWIIARRVRIWFHSSFASFWWQVRRLCVAETRVSAEVRRSRSIIMLSCATTARTRQGYLGSSSP